MALGRPGIPGRPSAASGKDRQQMSKRYPRILLAVSQQPHCQDSSA
jgi:hypothetical protein